MSTYKLSGSWQSVNALTGIAIGSPITVQNLGYTSGLISFQVLWDYDVTNATKTTIPYFNEANAYRGINDGVLEVSVLNAVTAPDSGAWTVTGAATVDDDGIEREFDFVPTQGVGNNSSGGVSSDRGFRIYAEGTGALIRIVSEDDDNTVLIGYNWRAYISG